MFWFSEGAITESCRRRNQVRRFACVLLALEPEGCARGGSLKSNLYRVWLSRRYLGDATLIAIGALTQQNLTKIAEEPGVPGGFPGDGGTLIVFDLNRPIIKPIRTISSNRGSLSQSRFIIKTIESSGGLGPAFASPE